MQTLLSRIVDKLPGISETGTVAGTIPAFFIGIKGQLAAQMRAGKAYGMKPAGLIPVKSQLFSLNLTDYSLALGQGP